MYLFASRQDVVRYVGGIHNYSCTVINQYYVYGRSKVYNYIRATRATSVFVILYCSVAIAMKIDMPIKKITLLCYRRFWNVIYFLGLIFNRVKTGLALITQLEFKVSLLSICEDSFSREHLVIQNYYCYFIIGTIAVNEHLAVMKKFVNNDNER